VCAAALKYLQFVRGLPIVAGVFTTTQRHANHSLQVPIPLPFQVGMARTQTARSVSSQLRRPKSHLNAVVFFTLFQPLSLSRTASANNPAPGGAAVFCFAGAPYEVLVPPTSRAPSKKADLGTWELSHTRALRVVCLERLRASKENFRCMYMLSGIGRGRSSPADVRVIRA
jgi:hypothetical protein